MTGSLGPLTGADWRAGARTVYRFSVLIVVLHAALSALGNEGLVAATARVALFPLTFLVHPFTAQMVPLLLVGLVAGILAGAPRAPTPTRHPGRAPVA
ncbi:MAG: hypothetical protein ACQETV_04865 [Actinomycetota bacterium]